MPGERNPQREDPELVRRLTRPSGGEASEELQEGFPTVRTPIRVDGTCEACGERVTDVRSHPCCSTPAPDPREEAEGEDVDWFRCDRCDRACAEAAYTDGETRLCGPCAGEVNQPAPASSLPPDATAGAEEDEHRRLDEAVAYSLAHYGPGSSVTRDEYLMAREIQRLRAVTGDTETREGA